MGRNLKTYDEKYRLITQCRQSGLADASWCRQNGIASSTFYSWVSQLRNIGYAIPDSENKEKCMPAQPQEVVKIELVPEENTSVPVCRSEMPAPESPSIRIDISGVHIEVKNDSDAQLLASILRTIGDMAWQATSAGYQRFTW